MREILAAVLLCVSVSVAQDSVQAPAPASSKPVWYAGGGLFVPLGDGSEYVENSFELLLGAEMVMTPQVSLRFEGGYISYGADEEKLREDAELPDDMKIDLSGRIIELKVLPILYLQKTRDFSLYVIVGAGIHLIRAEADMSYEGESFHDDSSEEDFGIELGGGVEFGLANGKKLGVVPSYHIIFTDDDDTRYFTLTGHLKF